MTVNASKTKTMVITSSTKDQEWNPDLTAGEMDIAPVKEYKFLGVTINNNMRFNSHVLNVVAKCKKQVNVLKCMAGKTWGNTVEIQRTLHIQYVRSALEYGSPCWSPWSSRSNIKLLQRVQNDALRSVGGLARTCPIDLLHLETGVEPLASRFAKNDQLMWERYRRLPGSDPRRQLMEREVPARLTTRLGWRHMTGPSMREFEYETFEEVPRIPPWSKAKCEFDAVELDRRKDEYTQEELKRIAMNKIESLFAEVIIYTDGSTSGNQENGGAGMYIEDGRSGECHEASFPAGKLSSSYGAEGVAMLKAMEWIRENECSTVICTDSMSLVQALKSNNWKDNNELLMRIKSQLQLINNTPTVLWVPSHCGIVGNERADVLADEGAKMSQEGIPVSHAIVKARIKRKKWDVSHPRGVEMYKGRRSPRFDIEKKWPRDVRRLFSRLRTDHAKELAYYRYLIDKEEDPACVCGYENETIKHVLCDCPALMMTRRRHTMETITIDQMISEPEMCRKILQVRFTGLKITNTNTNTNVEEGEDVGHPRC